MRARGKRGRIDGVGDKHEDEREDRSLSWAPIDVSFYPRYLVLATRFNVSLDRFVTGVVDREKFGAFERVLWRACRGNVFLRRADIEEELKDPKTNQPIFKVVFIAFFQV